MTSELEPMPVDWQRGLAIVAHPDDLEWGAAGAVAAWTSAAKEITYLLVTRGEAGIDGMPPEQAAPVREAEERASAAEVGVHTVEFLDHRDGVIEYGLALRAELARAIRRHRPELVLTINHHDYWGPGSWNTPDHRAVGRAALDAAADAGNRWIFPERAGLADPPVWDGVRWVAVNASPLASHTTSVDAAHRQRAIASLSAHRSYLAALGDNPVEEQAAAILGEYTSVTFELVTR